MKQVVFCFYKDTDDKKPADGESVLIYSDGDWYVGVFSGGEFTHFDGEMYFPVEKPLLWAALDDFGRVENE